MRARSLATALALMTLATPSLAEPDREALRAAFEGLDAAARATVQTELATAGFYGGAIDGRYGPGTERALVEGAAFLEFNSRGELAFDLARRDGIAAYVGALASGEAARWLYGEGDEDV